MSFNPGLRWMRVIAAAAFVLWLVASIIGLIAIYIGDEVVRPSINERSVPPPRTY